MGIVEAAKKKRIKIDADSYADSYVKIDADSYVLLYLSAQKSSRTPYSHDYSSRFLPESFGFESPLFCVKKVGERVCNKARQGKVQ